MKESDNIMIGSLFRTNNGEVIQVACISSKRQRRKIGYHKKGEPSKMYYVRLDQCEPIRLTDEIIALNGVKDVEVEDGYLFYDHGNVIGTYWHSEKGILEYPHIQCKYVHELQMLLHLCGQHTTANDFKLGI